jgi:hypothetical protein
MHTFHTYRFILVVALICLACLTSLHADTPPIGSAVPSPNPSDQNVAPQKIPGLLPLDLLEDDGVTSPVAAPEPASFVILGSGLIALSVALKRVNWPHQ